MFTGGMHGNEAPRRKLDAWTVSMTTVVFHSFCGQNYPGSKHRHARGIDPEESRCVSAAAMPVRLDATRLVARFYMDIAEDFLLSNKLSNKRPVNPPVEIKTWRQLATRGFWWEMQSSN
jgi:hypothetical protein